MSQLIGLRQHIRSIQTTRKITYAMRLISMSLYSKLEKQNAQFSFYQKTASNLFSHLRSQNPHWKAQLFAQDDVLNSRPLYVIISSSKGLAGGFNTNVIRYLKQALFLETHQQPNFITLGAKAHKFVQDEKMGTIIHHYPSYGSVNITTIAQEIFDYTYKNSYSSLTFFSTIFVNFFNQKVLKTQLLPLKNQTTPSEKKVDSKTPKEEPAALIFSYSQPIWEQTPSEILGELSALALKNSIQHLLFQSLISEQATRFMAMDHATTNADHFIEKLTLQYNKTRQSLITKELAELSAGFASFK